MEKLLMIVLSIFIPPLAVLLKRGLGVDLVINIVLWMLGVVPGIIHALWVTLK